MASFSDDGSTFNAAYGHRWRHHFGFDQLETVVDMLSADPNDRRAIITMWDPADLQRTTKDVACNLQIMPRIVGGTLEFTTTNRSNDVIWGLCGANAVHLSFLQEWMAGAHGLGRSEERRVGKERVRPCRSGGSPSHYKKKTDQLRQGALLT